MKKHLEKNLLVLAAVILVVSCVLPQALAEGAPSNNMLFLLNEEVRLSRGCVCFLADGSVVLAGTDSRRYDGANYNSAIMTCLASIDGQTHTVWKYEVCKEQSLSNHFYDVQALPDGSVLVLLVVSKENSALQRVEDQCYIHVVRDGELVAEYDFDEEIVRVVSTSNSVLIQTYDYTINAAGLPKFTCYDMSGKMVWQQVYQDSFLATQCLATEDGLYIVGSHHQPDGESSPYIAKIDQNGQMVWSRIEEVTNARYFGVALGENGDIVAAGGVFESGDGSQWTKADVVCYSTDGEVKWKDQRRFYDQGGFLWSAIERVEDGFVVAGSNYTDGNSLFIAHYDFAGNLIFFWDEPVSTKLGIHTYIGLVQNAAGDIYMTVCGDTGWRLAQKTVAPGVPRYITVIKYLSYVSPL